MKLFAAIKTLLLIAVLSLATTQSKSQSKSLPTFYSSIEVAEFFTDQIADISNSFIMYCPRYYKKNILVSEIQVSPFFDFDIFKTIIQKHILEQYPEITVISSWKETPEKYSLTLAIFGKDPYIVGIMFFYSNSCIVIVE